MCKAIGNSYQIVCCYCIEPNLYKKSDLGFRKADINQFKFLEQTILNLQSNLEAINGHLIITKNRALQDIPTLVDEYNITSIYAETEYASEELKLQNQLESKLKNIDFNYFWEKLCIIKRTFRL